MTTPSISSQPLNHATPRCAICLQFPHDVFRSLIPSCGHTFCAPCVLSWSTVRPACPLCKSSFSSLVVRRRLDGHILPDGCWAEEPISLLRRASWVQLEHVNDCIRDVEGAFLPLQGDGGIIDRDVEATIDGTVSTVAMEEASQWADEEMEEEREKSFWEEEERQWQEQRKGVKRLGNRRYGQNGYVIAGRMVARASRPGRGAASSSSAAQSSSSAGRRPMSKRRARKKRGRLSNDTSTSS